MAPQKTAKPIRTIRCGNVAAFIWRNDTKKKGYTIVRYSIRIQKRFRNQSGDYENSDYYFPDDLPKLTLAVEEAFRFITLRENTDAEQATPV